MFSSCVDIPSHTGTNFAILPELEWGVEAQHLSQPIGSPIGYSFFWLAMVSVAAGSFAVLKKVRVF